MVTKIRNVFIQTVEEPELASSKIGFFFVYARFIKKQAIWKGYYCPSVSGIVKKCAAEKPLTRAFGFFGHPL